jgi:hypothetical protein
MMSAWDTVMVLFAVPKRVALGRRLSEKLATAKLMLIVKDTDLRSPSALFKLFHGFCHVSLIIIER